MDQRRILLVLRHAQTEDVRPGSRDNERRLTPDGERQAREAGDYLRTRNIAIDAVLCSSAVRAQQTLQLLKIDDQLPANRVEIADRFYNAGADTLINAVRELPVDCRVALVVGHAPGAPGLVHEMADSDQLHAGGRRRHREPVSGCRAGLAGIRRRLVRG